MKPCKWILFYNEVTGRVGYVPERSRAAMKVKGTVYKSITGVERDAENVAREIERKHGIIVRC